MTALEISGYVQIVIGMAGIGVTMLTAPHVFDAASRIRAGEGLPREFSGAAGFVRVFTITFALVVFTFLIGLGLAVTLATVARAMGSAWPMLTASLLIGAVLGIALTATFAIYRSNLAAPAFVGSVLLIVLGMVAALHRDLDGFWGAMGVGIAIFIATSLGAIMVVAGIGSDRGPG